MRRGLGGPVGKTSTMVVRPSPLWASVGEGRSDGVDRAGVIMGNHHLHAGETTCDQTVAEREPAGTVRCDHQLAAEGFMMSFAFRANGDQARDTDAAAILADRYRHDVSPTCACRTYPRVGSGTRNHLVRGSRHLRCIQLGQRRDPERLNEARHPRCRDAANRALCDDLAKPPLRKGSRVGSQIGKSRPPSVSGS